MEIRGPRIIIKQLELEDAFKMRLWGMHENPLISDYNFPTLTDKEIEKWYRNKVSSWKNRYFGIINEEDRFIGYLGIKDIKRLKKESTLGLVLDPNFVGKRYGTETLTIFLSYYFRTLAMKRMYLEVAEFNRRAYRLYENMGFKPEGYYLDYFFDQNLDLCSSYYLEEQSSFVINNKKIYNYIHRMKLEKDDFVVMLTRS